MAEGEKETLSRIEAFPTVTATMLINQEGVPVRATLGCATTSRYAGLLCPLAVMAKNVVKDLDPQNELTFLRIRSEKHEIMIAPENEYFLITIQEARKQSTWH